jgi:hypothetical protein
LKVERRLAAANCRKENRVGAFTKARLTARMPCKQ